VQSVNLLADARFSDDKPNTLHAVKTDQLLVDGVYLKPGQKTGWHKHPDADRALGHRHPLAFDRNPIGALAKIIFGAMAIGDVAAGHPVRSDHALEPGADVGRDILVLPVVERECRARQRGQARQQGDLREPSHAILHSVAFASSWRPFCGAGESRNRGD